LMSAICREVALSCVRTESEVSNVLVALVTSWIPGIVSPASP